MEAANESGTLGYKVRILRLGVEHTYKATPAILWPGTEADEHLAQNDGRMSGSSRGNSHGIRASGYSSMLHESRSVELL